MSAPDALAQVEAGQLVQGLARVRVDCDACDRAFLVPPDHSEGPCVCGEGRVEPSPGLVPASLPEAIVPVHVHRERVRAVLAERIRSSWLLDRTQSPEALAAAAVLTWWPRWQVDATVVGHYSAEVGFDYEARSTVERYRDGDWTSEEQVDVRVDWQPRVGALGRRLHDVPVPALEHESERRRRLGEPGPQDPVDFRPDRLQQGWIELPDLHPDAVWQRAEPRFRTWAGRVIQQAAGGQHIREVHLHASFEELEWTTCLRPVWALRTQDADGAPRVLWLDGGTGQMDGRLRASLRRAWLWAALWGGLTVLAWIGAALCFVFGVVLPPLLVLAAVLGLVGVLGIPAAFLPPILAWRWNA